MNFSPEDRLTLIISGAVLVAFLMLIIGLVVGGVYHDNNEIETLKLLIQSNASPETVDEYVRENL